MTSAPFSGMWNRLPTVFRDEDRKRENMLHLWLESALDDQLFDLHELFERIDDNNGESELLSPDDADKEWLDWIGMIFGVKTNSTEEATTRHNLKYNRWMNGSATSMIRAMQLYMTGDKKCWVYHHSENTAAIGEASEWSVLLVIDEADWNGPVGFTASDAVMLAGAKPAGVTLWDGSGEGATWQYIHTNDPTWADWAAETWESLTTTD